MMHLTLCGADAGRPICDCNKAERAAAGDTFVHAMYWDEEKREGVCTDCLHVWDTVDED